MDKIYMYTFVTKVHVLHSTRAKKRKGRRMRWTQWSTSCYKAR